MKHIKTIASLALASVAMSAAAQSVIIKFKNEEAQTYSSDQIEYIQFSDQAAVDENNLLQEMYIPDPNFREYLNNRVANGSGYLTREEAAAFDKPINLDGVPNIVSLEGIQYFTSVSQLILTARVTIDFSTIPVLENITYFEAFNAKLGDHDYLATFPNVRNMSLYGCNLTGNYTFASQSLMKLDTGGSPGLTGLDVSGCPKMIEVCSTKCNLKTLNIGQCKLQGLYVYENPELAAIDLTYCGPTLSGLTCGTTSITSLDLSKCSDLENLEINNTLLPECPDLSKLTQLQTLRIENNQFTSVDLSKLRSLVDLYAYNCRLTSLDLTNNHNIKMVNAWDNQIETLSLDNNKRIKILSVDNNKLQRIDLTPCDPSVLTMLQARDMATLREVKVWPEFDINNPPEGYQISTGAEFVYEFSE